MGNKTTILSDKVIPAVVEEFKKAKQETKSKEEIIREQVSGYGSSDDAEAFAELFAKSMNNDKDEITTIFNKQLEKGIKELTNDNK